MKLDYAYWKLIAHSLGINLYHAIKTKKHKDKFLPKEYYRNYFASSKGGEPYKKLKHLESLGLTKSDEQENYVYFFVTKKGISLFEDYFIENVTNKYKKPSASKLRYQKYLEADCDESFPEWLGIRSKRKSV